MYWDGMEQEIVDMQQGKGRSWSEGRGTKLLISGDSGERGVTGHRLRPGRKILCFPPRNISLGPVRQCPSTCSL
jgi:hypothetical protein